MSLGNRKAQQSDGKELKSVDGDWNSAAKNRKRIAMLRDEAETNGDPLRRKRMALYRIGTAVSGKEPDLRCKEMHRHSID